MQKINREQELYFYKQLAYIDNEKEVYIVQHELTGKIYVKKIIDIYNINVYENIMKNPHKNISQIYECYEIDNKLIIIEEYINGNTLEEKLNEFGKLDESNAGEILLQICDGLKYLHNLNPPVIHRDIKLSNIMETNDGVIKIIDFNTSRHFNKYEVKDTVILGTVGYAAPEQYGFKQSDCRSDIYSLGVVLNYLLTGKHPNEELHMGAYKKIIIKCTDISPNNRFVDIKELKQALNNISERGKSKKHKQNRSYIIPGFRSKKVWKMIIAVTGYLFIFSIAFSMEVPDGNVAQNIINKIAFLLMALSYVALYANYLNIKEYLPMLSNKRVIIRIIGYVLFSFLVIIFFSIIASLFS